MHSQAFRITIHMVSSLDGFIAKPDNSMSWFEAASNYGKGVSLSEGQISAFLKAIDCYVMGANTYELAHRLSAGQGWAYGDTPVIVLTHRNLPVTLSTVTLYAGDIETLVRECLKPKYQNVWVVGGAEVTGDFLRNNLVDEIRQSILPILLGDGLPFFSHLMQELPLHLIDVVAYKNGMVELSYKVRR